MPSSNGQVETATACYGMLTVAHAPTWLTPDGQDLYFQEAALQMDVPMVTTQPSLFDAARKGKKEQLFRLVNEYGLDPNAPREVCCSQPCREAMDSC